MSPRVGIYRSDRQCRCFLAQCHLFATILRRNAPASASGSRIGGAQWHPDPTDMAKGPTVKNGKEAYLACLSSAASHPASPVAPREAWGSTGNCESTLSGRQRVLHQASMVKEAEVRVDFGAANVAAPLRQPTRATVRCAPRQARRAARERMSASGRNIVQRRTCNGNVND